GGGGDVGVRLDPRREELVGDGLSGLGRDGNDGDRDAAGLDLVSQLTARQHADPADLATDLRGIVVEDRRDPEALAREPLVVEQGGAEVTEADERNRPLAVEAEDLLELRFEAGDVVPDAADAELAEVREILPDLRGVQVDAL